MRTSSQLDEHFDACEFHKHTNLTTSSEQLLIAVAKKQIIRRMLEGEPIVDIGGEIDSILTEKKHVWENYEQRMSILTSAQNEIMRYVDFEKTRNDNRIFTNNLDTTVVINGETIDVKPDFIIKEGNTVRMCRVKTSRIVPDKQEIYRNETYALGMLGEKFFPDAQILVDYYHLKPSSKDQKEIEDAEKRGYTVPYGQYSMYNAIPYSPKLKEELATKFEKEQVREASACSKADCAACPMNNICNYKEAPISLPAEERVCRLSDINPTMSQRAIINFKKGIARVNAGAGAGKTFVVAARIAALLEDGVRPEEICLLTFTKTGAEEMTARAMGFAAEKSIPLDPDNLMSTTINAFCQHIVTENYEALGYTRPPRVIPDANKYAIINRILDVYPKVSNWKYGSVKNPYSMFGKLETGSAPAFDTALNLFATIKREGYTRENNPYLEIYSPTDLNIIFMMYDEFEKQLKQNCLIEYDDQLKLVVKLLDINPHLLEEMGYKHILVDEFQDTDYDQIQLLNKMIDTPNFESFMAVGDDSQSIFGFRHTSPEYMINFQQYFGRFHDFPLLENHRSVKPIIDFANKVNSFAYQKVDKDLIATKLSETQPVVQGFYSPNQEYDFIAKDIKRRWDNGERDIAVLTSNRNEIAEIAAKLTALEIPSVSMNPVLYKENCRVAALLSFYDSFTGKSTQGFVDYQNVIANGELRKASAEELELIASEFGERLKDTEKNLVAFKAFARALDESGLDEVYGDFLEQLDFCETIEELNEFIENFNTYGDRAAYKREGKYNGVCLITVHSAKGLEWDTTYLTLSKFEQARDPHFDYNNRRHDTAIFDETIRKYFVGATRARKELIITGQFVPNRSNRKESGYLQMAYANLNKMWDFSPSILQQTIGAEKAKANSERNMGLGLNIDDFKSLLKKDKKKKTKEEEKEEKQKLKDIYKSGEKPKVSVSVEKEPEKEEDLSLDL